MSLFPLAISCLTMSSLPWFMDLTFQVPMQYLFFTALYFAFTTRHIQNWALFPLWFSLFIPSGAISLLLSCSILDTYQHGEFIFQCPIFLPFHIVHGVLKARILKWFAVLFSSGPHSVRSLHHDLPILGCPTGMAYFHWVRQGCGPSVIRLTSFLWVWFQCVFPLMPSCNTYRLTWISLTLGMGYLFTAAPAKHSHCSLACMRGISSWPAPPFLEHEVALLDPPVPGQLPLVLTWFN